MSEVKVLTPKREAFARLVGLENISQSEAYRRTYDIVNVDPEKISQRASALARQPEVAARIAELRDRGAADARARTRHTREKALEEAEEIRVKALAAGKLDVAKSAAALKAQLSGLLVERREVKTGPLEETDVDDLLAMREELERRRVAEGGAVIPDDNRPVAH